jgi:hypothetical protein
LNKKAKKEKNGKTTRLKAEIQVNIVERPLSLPAN